MQHTSPRAGVCLLGEAGATATAAGCAGSSGAECHRRADDCALQQAAAGAANGLLASVDALRYSPAQTSHMQMKMAMRQVAWKCALGIALLILQALHSRITKVIELAAEAGVNVLCLQEAWTMVGHLCARHLQTCMLYLRNASAAAMFSTFNMMVRRFRPL